MKEVEILNTRLKLIQNQKQEADKHLQALQLEYCQNQA
jgi:hypothetical protein